LYKRKKGINMGKYSEFEQSQYFILECPHCTNGFLTETFLRETEIAGLPAYDEPERDGSFQVYCPRCGKKVTGLATEKVMISIWDMSDISEEK